MELSPEERQEARQQPQQEPATPKKPQRLRLVWPLLVVCGLVFVVSVFVDSQSPEKQAADEKAAKQQYDIYKGKLEQAKELDVLHDLNANGASIKVTVGPAFFTVPIDTQQEFARTVNCFFVKGAGRGISFDLIHWQTGKKVAAGMATDWMWTESSPALAPLFATLLQYTLCEAPMPFSSSPSPLLHAGVI